LNLKRWAMMQGNGAPTQCLHILHGMAKKILVCHSVWTLWNSEVTLLAVEISVGELDAAVTNKIFQCCKRFVHDAHLNLLVIGIRRSRPKARGVIFTPGAD